MFAKIESFKKLVSLGLNVHRYFIPESYEEYVDTVKDLTVCTIRTDHQSIVVDLPFYVMDTTKCHPLVVESIWKTALKNDYKLIISDGIKYDPIQEYNLVARFESNGDFIFDASELKIPLRHMYRCPMLSCYGNISEEVSEWTIINNKYGLDRCIIKHDLELLYSYQLYNQWLEVTKYPKGVGIQHEPIVFWQIGRPKLGMSTGNINRYTGWIKA